jgi:hypothetical protein
VARPLPNHVSNGGATRAVAATRGKRPLWAPTRVVRAQPSERHQSASQPSSDHRLAHRPYAGRPLADPASCRSAADRRRQRREQRRGHHGAGDTAGGAGWCSLSPTKIRGRRCRHDQTGKPVATLTDRRHRGACQRRSIGAVRGVSASEPARQCPTRHAGEHDHHSAARLEPRPPLDLSRSRRHRR